MYQPVIDAHIHLDKYHKGGRKNILQELDTYGIEALIAVSENLISAKENLALAQEDKRIKPAFGWHPEQELPTENEIADIQDMIVQNQDEMIAVGEVGLPYYLRKKHPEIPSEPYLEILELLIRQSVQLDKPIVLHAVYEDASTVCDLLEKYDVNKAHFHWFKGDSETTERMILNRYFISVTPDVIYEAEIQQLVRDYPLKQMMVETDGPWPFKGPFENKLTHPKMMHQTIRKIAAIKKMDMTEVYRMLLENTKRFYRT